MKDNTSLKVTLKMYLVGLICALIPVAVCILRLAFEGKTLWDVYLPNSNWNDELLYYKLTEACVHYTIPQGFFGFNESHAIVGSFAAWSPALLAFWDFWGIVFGWSILSPILCNLFMIAMGMYFLGKFLRPNRWQILSLVVLFATFKPVTRFTLSGMPEAQIYAMLLFIIALAWDTDQRIERSTKAYTLRVIVIGLATTLLMLMRPYYILLFGLLVYLVRKKWSKKATWITSISVIGVATTVYFVISHFFSAPYLTDLFYTDWLTAYKEGLLHGLKYDVWKLTESVKSIFTMMLHQTSEGKLLAGSLYFLFLMCLVFWVIMVIQKDKWKIPFIIRVQMLVLMVGFFGADLMMYRLQEGGRHTVPFIFVTLMMLPFLVEGYHVPEQLISGAKDKPWGIIVPSIIASAVTVVVFLLLGKLPYEFDIPYATQERVKEVNSLQQQLEENIDVNMGTPSYENTIIWPIWDKVDGETVVFDWGMLYAIPAGMGINACDGGYVEAQMENLQCGYIATMKGSDVETCFDKTEKDVIGENQTLIVYKCN